MISTPRRGPALASAALLALCIAPVGAVAGDGELAQVLERFDRVQVSIRTLSAEFTETTTSDLLTDAIVASGRVYLTKPDAVRWEYTAPEEMRFVIRNDEYTGYFPGRKRAEKRDVRRWSEQLFRLLGIGQASTELERFYEISLADPGDEMPGTLLLILDPTKKRVRKRIDPVRFWIDAASYLPVRVEYQSKGGSRREVRFDRMEVNPVLAASLYEVELPADVKVTRGFSALSGLGTGSSD